jgi:proline iminopeptidase
VADLERIREWIGVDEFMLIGHSWGGLVAMAYVASHPSRLQALVLVGSAAPDYWTEQDANRAVRDNFRAREEQGSIPPIPDWIGDGCEGWWPHFVAYYDDPSILDQSQLPTSCSDDVLRKTWRINGKYDLRPQLANATMPLLIVYGDRDPLKLVDASIYSAFRSEPKRYRILESCGHRPMFECPADFYPHIHRFLLDATQ